MAKSAKIVPLKPENFIKSRARELDLYKCYISTDWETSGIANALVIRKHNNGNFTFGAYLVDLTCLGVKDTWFRFNIDEEELGYIIDRIPADEIDYNTVHNIIYGAYEFALEYGFKPHKDWAITQHLLEEDDERIPIIDIEFGEQGLPAYYAGPNDTPAKIKQILATLNKNAGEGNYYFYNDADDEAFSPTNEDDELGAANRMLRLQKMYFDLTAPFRKTNKAGNKLDEALIEKISEEKVIDNYYTIDDELEDEIFECIDIYEETLEEKSIESIDKIKRLLSEKPNNPYLYTELFLQYKIAQLNNEADAIAKQGLELFPDFLHLRLFVAHAAMIDKETEKGLAMLNNSYYLDQAFPHRAEFSEGEFMFFYAALCEYFLLIDDLTNAIICADFLIDDVNRYACNRNAIYHLYDVIESKMDI